MKMYEFQKCAALAFVNGREDLRKKFNDQMDNAKTKEEFREAERMYNAISYEIMGMQHLLKEIGFPIEYIPKLGWRQKNEH